MYKIFQFSQPVMTDALMDRILDGPEVTTYPPRTWLLKEGEISSDIWFVESGLLRCFYVKNRKEISSWFAPAGNFCWSPVSFLQQTPSPLSIQVMQTSTVFRLGYHSFRNICESFPEFEFLQHEITRRHLLADEARLHAMWMQNSRQKLEWFRTQFPQIFGVVPGKYIASYLGITNVMLSRLRNSS